MSFKKEVESTGTKPQHEWARKWDKRDWELHDLELQEIDRAILECLDEDKFQEKYGAIKFVEGCGNRCRCMGVKDFKHETPCVTDPYQYQINRWKLDKWGMWLYAQGAREQEELKLLNEEHDTSTRNTN